ncbi:hypothetical protein K4A83_20065 [Spirulina subsalsa FACHB-351]|uniref:Uncharacterized protein n=1 Tax=Spirulina subsalsa FACHB-351 TaxID=234711 RepID=A0ABT3LAP3_9CYAN|nr:hypothetical protein [Spirulina subsalsa]MCW6038552.1 hypothetical protein [Spirulina subsalsa FACHB-351]
MSTIPNLAPDLNFGRFWLLTEEGYLINDCQRSLIQDPWLPLVEEWMEGCVVGLGDRLHSLYLRGSIPRGLAVQGLSDLDGIVLTHQPLDDLTTQILFTLAQKLSRRYLFCPKVEILPLTLDDLRGDWAVLLATQGLNLWGQDVIPHLPPVKVSPALVHYLPTLEQDLQRVTTELRHSPTCTLSRCRWICPRLVRAGFELVMESEGQFTRDLGLSAVRFGVYYPQQARGMNLALKLALEPTGDRGGLLVFLQQFGGWLVREFGVNQQNSFLH